MIRKISLIVCVIALCMTLCVPTFAAKLHTDGKLAFSECTEGAAAAFDGNRSTAFAGSITGKFAKRSVITGITVRAEKAIVNLKVYGSEDGSNWIEIYQSSKIRSLTIFGSNGSDSYTEEIYNNMYTYAFTYLRFEAEYGSFAEIELRGYEVDVKGKIAELDTDYAKGGYDSSGSYYEDNRGHYMLDHIIGSPDRGDVITYADSLNKYAFLTLKLKEAQPLSAISFIHKTNDKNVTRWDGVKFEVSKDGEVWKTVEVLPGDFSTRGELRDRTIVLVTVKDTDAYSYVRVSSTTGSLSIGAVDVYADVKAPALDVSKVVNGWEGDPYIGAEAPAETEAETEAEAETNGNADTSESSPTDKTEKDGCNAALAAPVAVIAVAMAASVAVLPKKRSKEI